jgi:hypothetical protein
MTFAEYISKMLQSAKGAELVKKAGLGNFNGKVEITGTVEAYISAADVDKLLRTPSMPAHQIPPGVIYAVGSPCLTHGSPFIGVPGFKRIRQLPCPHCYAATQPKIWCEIRLMVPRPSSFKISYVPVDGEIPTMPSLAFDTFRMAPLKLGILEPSGSWTYFEDIIWKSC